MRDVLRIRSESLDVEVIVSCYAANAHSKWRLVLAGVSVEGDGVQVLGGALVPAVQLNVIELAYPLRALAVPVKAAVCPKKSHRRVGDSHLKVGRDHKIELPHPPPLRRRTQ